MGRRRMSIALASAWRRPGRGAPSSSRVNGCSGRPGAMNSVAMASGGRCSVPRITQDRSSCAGRGLWCTACPRGRRASRPRWPRAGGRRSSRAERMQTPRRAGTPARPWPTPAPPPKPIHAHKVPAWWRRWQVIALQVVRAPGSRLPAPDPARLGHGACAALTMARDHRKLAVFTAAEQLVIETYAISRPFPASETFGLQAQLRRAAVSVPSNIVKGSSRRTTREYLRFLNVAAGSAVEAAYLVGLSERLGLLGQADGQRMKDAFEHLAARLHAIVRTLEAADTNARAGKPEAGSRRPEAGSRIESRPRAPSPGDTLGPYEIQALVGKGGMGEVYRARDPRLNRDVAVKLSNTESPSGSRARRARLRH